MNTMITAYMYATRGQCYGVKGRERSTIAYRAVALYHVRGVMAKEAGEAVALRLGSAPASSRAVTFPSCPQIHACNTPSHHITHHHITHHDITHTP